MEERYLPPTLGGIWAISREIEGRWLPLIERRPVYDLSDPEAVLRALGIVPTPEHLNRYFPENERGCRCPTLELLELFAKLGSEKKKECGV